VNGSFLDNATTPFGWAVDGAPATQALVTLPVAEGRGNGLRLADVIGATTDGIDQTVSGLKAGTLYLVEARVIAATANVVLTTTGAAAGTFTNLAVPSSGTSYQTLAGLVLTDATPTSIEVSLRPDSTNYDFTAAWLSMREVASTASTATNEHEGTSYRGGNYIRSITDTTTGAMNGAATATVETNTTLSVVVPGPGYVIEVTAEATIQMLGGGDTATVRIAEQINGGGWNTVASRQFVAGSQDTYVAHVTWMRGADATNTLTAGSLYQYRISGTSSDANSEWDTGASGADVHRLVVRLLRMG
jgi:hypothetical protein